MDGEGFQDWVRKHLVPVLSSYTNLEPNAIVVMDNASTHMSREVADLIEATGAYLLYLASYSPNLSPIEYFFSIYKRNLKKYSNKYTKEEWFKFDLHALREI